MDAVWVSAARVARKALRPPELAEHAEAGVVDDLFTIQSQYGTDAVVECQGELDICAVPDLQAALEQASRRQTGEVRVNMAEVRYIDSACIKALLAAKDNLAAHGARLILVTASPPVLRALRLLSLDAYFGLP